ncbi:hypothetical protein KC19_8G095100, partial [Ceratodon purpureus]
IGSLGTDSPVVKREAEEGSKVANEVALKQPGDGAAADSLLCGTQLAYAQQHPHNNLLPRAAVCSSSEFGLVVSSVLVPLQAIRVHVIDGLLMMGDFESRRSTL